MTILGSLLRVVGMLGAIATGFSSVMIVFMGGWPKELEGTLPMILFPLCLGLTWWGSKIVAGAKASPEQNAPN